MSKTKIQVFLLLTLLSGALTITWQSLDTKKVATSSAKEIVSEVLPVAPSPAYEIMSRDELLFP